MTNLIGRHDYTTRGKQRRIEVREKDGKVIIASGWQSGISGSSTSLNNPHAISPGLQPGDLTPSDAMWLSGALYEGAVKADPSVELYRAAGKGKRR